MRSFAAAEFEGFLARAGVRRSDPKIGIGGELSFVDGPLRLLVVHFAENEHEKYIAEVFDNILALDRAWLVAPRHGTVGDIGLLNASRTSPAVCVDNSGKEALKALLCGCLNL